MFRRSFALFVIVAVAGFGAGCDFGAAGDAFDEFDVIIGLEPIDTVVNGVVVDASTGELVNDARLTFSGPDANLVIDAYSDPVDALNADGGTVTFGIVNGVTPTSGSPVEITVLIRAEGYFDRERSLVITEQGDARFQANMVPLDVGNRSVTLPGTDVDDDEGTSTGASTGLTQSLLLQAQTPLAEAVLSVPEHSTPVDGTGTPLEGTLTTGIRIFDGSTGLKSLPSGALESEDGSQLSVAMAAWFRMVDDFGRVAVSFVPPGGKASGSATACEDAGGTSLTLTSSEPSYVSAVQAMGGVASVDIHAYTPADGMNNAVGSIPVTLSGGAVSGEICLGGAEENIDTGLIGDASDGYFYTFAIAGSSVATGTLDHTVSVTNPNGSSKQVTFALVGPGFLESSTAIVPPGPNAAQTLSSLVDQGGAVSVVPGSDYVFSASLSTGETAVVTISDPLSGSSSLTIPQTNALQTFDLTASLSCDDPVNQEFDVQITTESLDAVSIFYREDLPGNSWTLLPRKAITDKTATDASIEITATIDLKPSTTYRVRGTLANNSVETIETSPPAAGAWTVTMSTGELGLDCSDR